MEAGKLRTLKSLLDAGEVIAVNEKSVTVLRAGRLLDDLFERVYQRQQCALLRADAITKPCTHLLAVKVQAYATVLHCVCAMK
jgi:hypothetical protein